MDVHQLELRYAAHQNRIDACVCVEPFHEIGHQRFDFMSRRRGVNGFSGHRIDDQVLSQSVLAGCCRASTHILDQPFVDLADQCLGILVRLPRRNGTLPVLMVSGVPLDMSLSSGIILVE